MRPRTEHRHIPRSPPLPCSPSSITREITPEAISLANPFVRAEVRQEALTSLTTPHNRHLAGGIGGDLMKLSAGHSAGCTFLVGWESPISAV